MSQLRRLVFFLARSKELQKIRFLILLTTTYCNQSDGEGQDYCWSCDCLPHQGDPDHQRAQVFFQKQSLRYFFSWLPQIWLIIHNHALQENGRAEVDLYGDFAGPDPREIWTDAGLSQNCRRGGPFGKGLSFLFQYIRKFDPKPSNVATHCFHMTHNILSML